MKYERARGVKKNSYLYADLLWCDITIQWHSICVVTSHTNAVYNLLFMSCK